MSYVELQHQRFLQLIRNHVADYPEVSPYIQKYISDGLTEALHENRRIAVDMETIALAALQNIPRSKYYGKLIIDKILKWKGKTSVPFDNWDEIIKKIESKRTKNEVS